MNLQIMNCKWKVFVFQNIKEQLTRVARYRWALAVSHTHTAVLGGYHVAVRGGLSWPQSLADGHTRVTTTRYHRNTYRKASRQLVMQITKDRVDNSKVTVSMK